MGNEWEREKELERQEFDEDDPEKQNKGRMKETEGVIKEEWGDKKEREIKRERIRHTEVESKWRWIGET